MDLASVFDHCQTVVAIVRQEDARFIEVNAAMQEQLGWLPGEVIGKRTVDIDLWPDPDTRARIWSALRTRRRVIGMPLQARHRDGRLIESLLDVECFERDGVPLTFCLLRVGTEALEVGPDPEVEQASYRELYLSATEGLYRSLPDGGFIDVNPAMAEIFGFESAAQMLGRAGHAATEYYADREHGRDVRRRLERDGEIRSVRSRIRRVDGAERWVLENAHSVRDEAGRLRFFEGSVVDITDQVASESALQQSESMYRVLVDNCRDGVFLIQHGRFVFANPALADMLGHRQASMTGMEYIQLVADEDRAAQGQRREEREGGSMASQSYEVHVLNAKGERRLFSILADAVIMNGEPASTGLARDITEARAEQLAIEAAERRYRELFEQSPVGLFRTLQDGTIVDANPAMVAMLGYADMQQLIDQVGNVIDLYADPNERPILVERMMRDGRLTDHETRVKRQDGRPVWVNVNVRLQTESSQTTDIRFAGSVQDIQHRRVIEDALLRSEARYRMLIEHSQTGVFVARRMRYVYVNQRMATMFGYTEQELKTMSFSTLLAPEAREAAFDRLNRFELGEDLPQEFESCYLSKSGDRVYVIVSAGPIDLDGERHLTGTVRDITRHREVEKRLRFHATHDALTGLPNRMVFHQKLEQRMREAQGSGDHHYAVLFVDLDGFKLVNDGLGHAAGDRLLVELAGELEKRFEGRALVARYGGDEFTLLSIGSCDLDQAEAMAERLLGMFVRPRAIDGHRVYSGASVGIVMGHSEYTRPDQILRDADTAMYRAKASGKSAYVVFDDSMHEAAQRRLTLETDLRQALELGEFRVHFQPIVEIDNGRIRGCEALLRWKHPKRGLLFPADFLDVAEEAGLLPSIDWWVLQHAATLLSQWHQRFPEHADIRVSVNMDERQFGEPGLAERVASVISATGIRPEHVQLEITETVFRNGRQHAATRLRELKSLGLALVVDDFGTGYSSLESFASAPFDALKIDHSFVADLTSNARHLAIVRTIVAFADDLGMSLIAEGVETAEQQQLLIGMGCRFAQGYLFSRPVDQAAFERLLADPRGIAGSIA